MRWYINVIKKTLVFEGRSSRKEYWMFYLINFIILFVLSFIEGLISTPDQEGSIKIAQVYYLLILIPSVAAGIRRMHDVGKSGFNLFIPIYNLVLLVSEGDKGRNEYCETPFE